MGDTYRRSTNKPMTKASRKAWTRVKKEQARAVRRGTRRPTAAS